MSFYVRNPYTGSWDGPFDDSLKSSYDEAGFTTTDGANTGTSTSQDGIFDPRAAQQAAAAQLALQAGQLGTQQTSAEASLLNANAGIYQTEVQQQNNLAQLLLALHGPENFGLFSNELRGQPQMSGLAAQEGLATMSGVAAPRAPAQADLKPLNMEDLTGGITPTVPSTSAAAPAQPAAPTAPAVGSPAPTAGASQPAAAPAVASPAGDQRQAPDATWTSTLNPDGTVTVVYAGGAKNTIAPTDAAYGSYAPTVAYAGDSTRGIPPQWGMSAYHGTSSTAQVARPPGGVPPMAGSVPRFTTVQSGAPMTGGNIPESQGHPGQSEWERQRDEFMASKYPGQDRHVVAAQLGYSNQAFDNLFKNNATPVQQPAGTVNTYTGPSSQGDVNLVPRDAQGNAIVSTTAQPGAPQPVAAAAPAPSAPLPTVGGQPVLPAPESAPPADHSGQNDALNKPLNTVGHDNGTVVNSTTPGEDRAAAGYAGVVRTPTRFSVNGQRFLTGEPNAAHPDGADELVVVYPLQRQGQNVPPMVAKLARDLTGKTYLAHPGARPAMASSVQRPLALAQGGAVQVYGGGSPIMPDATVTPSGKTFSDQFGNPGISNSGQVQASSAKNPGQYVTVPWQEAQATLDPAKISPYEWNKIDPETQKAILSGYEARGGSAATFLWLMGAAAPGPTQNAPSYVGLRRGAL